MQITRGALEAALEMAGSGDRRAELNAIKVEKDGRVIATDGHVLAVISPMANGKAEKLEPALLDRAGIEQVIRNIPKEKGAAREAEYVKDGIFKVGSQEIKVGLVDHSYPPVDQIYPRKDKPVYRIQFRADLIGSLARAAQKYSGESQCGIEFEFYQKADSMATYQVLRDSHSKGQYGDPKAERMGGAIMPMRGRDPLGNQLKGVGPRPAIKMEKDGRPICTSCGNPTNTIVCPGCAKPAARERSASPLTYEQRCEIARRAAATRKARLEGKAPVADTVPEIQKAAANIKAAEYQKAEDQFQHFGKSVDKIIKKAARKPARKAKR